MNNDFKVAILQLDTINDSDKSLVKGIEACKKARELGADIAVFPEMWNIGYEMPSNKNKINKWMSKAITENDKIVIK